MKKILIVVYTYSLGGGVEKILSNIVSNLDHTKYDITILPYAEYGVKKENISSKVRVLPSIVDMKTAGRIEKITKYFLVHFFPWVLRKIYVKDKYDIEISFNYQIPSFLVKSKKGTKVIEWIHGDINDLKSNTLKRKLQKRSFKKADKIVAISQNTKQSIVDVFPIYKNKVQLVYNGIDAEIIRERAQESTDIKLKENSVVFLGRLEEAKKPLKLAEAVKEAIEDNMDINLYLLGQGEQFDELKEKIEEWGLNERIFLLGYQQNPYPIIKQSKAVCMMSRSEGFPTVFTEGMVLGKPFISTAVGGVEELSNDGKCGIIVDSTEQFKEALAKAVLDSEESQKMQEACLEHIKNYSIERQIETIEDMLDSIRV